MSSPGRAFELHVLEDVFTAEVTIKRSSTTKRANERGYFDAAAEIVKTELLDVTLTASSIESLKAKVHAHVGLVEVEE